MAIGSTPYQLCWVGLAEARRVSKVSFFRIDSRKITMPLSLFLFSPKTHLVGEVERSGRAGKFGHTFGGTCEQFDLQIENTASNIHLVYRIDLSDPAIPLKSPSVNYLPLLYCFAGQLECSYLVLPGNKVKILDPISDVGEPPFEVPRSFPPAVISFAKQHYDPTNADDVMQLKGVFGWDELSKSEKARALELARSLSSLTESDGIDENWTYETVIDCMYEPPFAQGDPVERCKNPDCEKSDPEVTQWMNALAIQTKPVADELIWPDEFVQTLWMTCSACGSITALNRL